MKLTLYSKGAAREVTGSRHFIEVDGQTIQVDCGAFQGRRKEADGKNRRVFHDPEKIGAVILTHGHFDHCGLLPVLAKQGYGGNIYATAATRDIAALVMMDSARIQARDREYLSKQAAKRNEEFTWQPLYDETHVLAAIDHFVTLSYRRGFSILDGVRLEFFDAGHILGSSLAELTFMDRGSGRDVRVVFSGDLGRRGKPIIRDPEKVRDPDFLIMESTYGDRLHDCAADSMEKLAAVVRQTAARGGRIIIPAFAVERTQELVYFLHLLSDQRRIPEIPIYVDSPMATNATAIFQVHPECYDEEISQAFLRHQKNPFGFNNLHYTASVQESKDLNRLTGPAIIISADGMCEAGRVVHHLANGVEDSRNTILIVGFMAANTLGRRIREGQKDLRIMGMPVRVKAAVEELSAFSAHADYREIGEYITGLDMSRLKKVFLVHGEGSSQEHLKKHLLGLGVPAVEIVDPDTRYELCL
ncbi:MAG: MBL fold metallo-hydrolase [Spirochaetales bacterium]|jgi:metallo-beta-lactamase family protein|nr:MBL fold metallo-hydrolase [Spirochaetales bacterium]